MQKNVQNYDSTMVSNGINICDRGGAGGLLAIFNIIITNAKFRREGHTSKILLLNVNRVIQDFITYSNVAQKTRPYFTRDEY